MSTAPAAAAAASAAPAIQPKIDYIIFTGSDSKRKIFKGPIEIDMKNVDVYNVDKSQITGGASSLEQKFGKSRKGGKRRLRKSKKSKKSKK